MDDDDYPSHWPTARRLPPAEPTEVPEDEQYPQHWPTTVTTNKEN